MLKGFALLLAAIWLSVGQAAEFNRASVESRRDVDVTYAENTLIVLAFTAGRWTSFELSGSMLSTKCSFSGRAYFSHDRTQILSLTTAAPSRLQSYDLKSCTPRRTLTLPAATRDADVSEARGRVVVAARDDGALRLRLFDFEGNQTAELGTASSAEIGFSPSGDVVANFDHAGGALSAWNTDDGSPVFGLVPLGFDPIYSGDGRQLFATRAGTVYLTQTGENISTLERDEGLRGSSQRGNTVVLQAPNPLQPAWPKVRLFDRTTARTIPLGSGHIDATALSADGSRAAIAIRDQRTQRVTITERVARELFTP